MGSIDKAVTAERAGCDFIIAQGIEAGANICGTLGLLPLLSQILDRVIRVQYPQPGIWQRPLRHARRVTAESAAHPAYVEAIIKARTEDAVRTDLYQWAACSARRIMVCLGPPLRRQKGRR